MQPFPQQLKGSGSQQLNTQCSPQVRLSRESCQLRTAQGAAQVSSGCRGSQSSQWVTNERSFVRE